MPSFRRGVHVFATDVRLFSVGQGAQFDYSDAYLAYHRICEVHWDDQDCVARFLYD